MAKQKHTINDALGELLRAAQFQPFDIKTADGDTIRVIHPDFIGRSPAASTAVVYDRDGHFRIVHLDMIVTLEPARNGSRKPGKR